MARAVVERCVETMEYKSPVCDKMMHKGSIIHPTLRANNTFSPSVTGARLPTPLRSA